jgi:hypothetical protein
LLFTHLLEALMVYSIKSFNNTYSCPSRYKNTSGCFLHILSCEQFLTALGIHTVKLHYNMPHYTVIWMYCRSSHVSKIYSIYVLGKHLCFEFCHDFFCHNLVQMAVSSQSLWMGNMTLHMIGDLLRRCWFFSTWAMEKSSNIGICVARWKYGKMTVRMKKFVSIVIWF